MQFYGYQEHQEEKEKVKEGENVKLLDAEEAEL
jgi:hypothetical protein